MRNFLVGLIVVLATACSGNSFSGGGQKAAAVRKAEPAKTEPQGPAPGSQPLGNPGTPSPASPGSPTGPSSPSLTPPGTGEDQNNNNPNSGAIGDLLQGLLGNGGDISQLGSQPNDNEIIFGESKTFHLGDGQMDQSSCLIGISPFPVAGKQYIFEFDVLGAGAISINIGVICGVDYSDTNSVYLVQNGQPVGQQYPLPVGANTFDFPPQTLQPGHYAVGVESRVGTKDPGGNPDDADDYIIGKVRIQSQGAKMKIGKVYVN